MTNNSGAAVAAYLARHHLAGYVGKIVGRDDPDPALMKPSPYRVRIAVGSPGAEPEECVFIGDTVTDVLAGLLGGVVVIGYANKPGKDKALAEAGARAVVIELASDHGRTPGHPGRCTAELSRIRSRRRASAPLARCQRRAQPWEARPPHTGPHS